METNDTTSQEKKRLPVDLFSDEMPTKEVNPFADKVKEKGYTNVQAQLPPSTNGSDQQAPPPPVETAFKESKEKESEPSTAEKAFNNQEFKSTPPPPQPAGDASTLPSTAETSKTPEEIQSNATQTVNLFWRGYEKLHAFGRWIGKVDKNDLANMHLRGKIDLKYQFPLEDDFISAGEFFKNANNQIDETIQVSPKLKDEVSPAMERICIKRGWLLNDEGFVIITLLDDISTKAGLLIGVKKSCNDVLQALVTMQDEKKKKESNTSKESEKKSNKESTTKSTNKSGTSDTKESEGNIPAEEGWNVDDEPTEPEEKGNQGNTGEQQTTT